MRLIDESLLPRHQVKIYQPLRGGESMVYDAMVVFTKDIHNAKTVRAEPVFREKTIPVRWLQKKMADAIADSEEHLDSKYFLLINKFIAEWEEQNADS